MIEILPKGTIHRMQRKVSCRAWEGERITLAGVIIEKRWSFRRGGKENKNA